MGDEDEEALEIYAEEDFEDEEKCETENIRKPKQSRPLHVVAGKRGNNRRGSNSGIRRMAPRNNTRPGTSINGWTNPTTRPNLNVFEEAPNPDPVRSNKFQVDFPCQ